VHASDHARAFMHSCVCTGAQGAGCNGSGANLPTRLAMMASSSDTGEWIVACKRISMLVLACANFLSGSIWGMLTIFLVCMFFHMYGI
jgi:hypothetical protein